MVPSRWGDAGRQWRCLDDHPIRFELLAGAAPASPDDRRLAHLIAMFRVLNTCGIEGRVAPADPSKPG